MFDYLVSLVMPVYNASKYLDESIGSVLSQDYLNWELLCVDDGSTDDSLEVLHRYAQINKRIRVFSQKNAGPAQARKLGIENSIGDFIVYVDSDDTISNDFISMTLSSAVKSNADVTMPVLMAKCFSNKSNCYNFNDRHDLYEGQVLKPREAFKRTFPWSVHGLNLYRAAHIKKYALTEISNINNFNADEYLTRHLLLYANKVVISGGIYYYRASEGSITSCFSLRQLGVLVVNDELFKLAIKEAFEKDFLIRIAKLFFRDKMRIKYKVFSFRGNFANDDFNDAIKKINKACAWDGYVPALSFISLKYRYFYALRNYLNFIIFRIKNYKACDNKF